MIHDGHIDEVIDGILIRRLIAAIILNQFAIWLKSTNDIESIRFDSPTAVDRSIVHDLNQGEAALKRISTVMEERRMIFRKSPIFYVRQGKIIVPIKIGLLLPRKKSNAGRRRAALKARNIVAADEGVDPFLT